MQKRINEEKKIFSLLNKPFKPEDIESVFNVFIKGAKLIGTNKKIYYYNLSSALDFETTSFYYNGKKHAIMYAWGWGFNGAVIVGRTWEQLLFVYEKIVALCELNEYLKLRVYIHNMAFDFQFFRKWFTFEKVFALEERKVVEVETIDHIQFRCSYLLSGYSLQALGGQLQKYKVQKAVGDLDYSLIRHSKTPLTEKEIGYLVNDVLVVMAYIQEKIENDGNITKIPLTKTGYVRSFCKKKCFNGFNDDIKKRKYHDYRNSVKSLTLTVEEYDTLQDVFAGGFTHANAIYSRAILYNVGSADLTSSYPTVMVAEKFPMSRGKLVKVNSLSEFHDLMEMYCCIFEVMFKNLEPKIFSENPISYSKCEIVGYRVLNNGRVVCAEELYTTMTEVDFSVVNSFYKWSEIRIGKIYRYRRAYLPRNFVKSVLVKYRDKTELKDVIGQEYEYLLAKQDVNAIFGMCVTDIVREEFPYIGEEWGDKKEGDKEKMIDKYNNNPSRFLSYVWGIYVTSYARRNLFSAIHEFGDDHVYSDTDSEKGLNFEMHKPYFDKYNNLITEKLEEALTYHKISFDYIRPKTIKGIEKPLGIWEYEGNYNIFKTLGAKRYMTFKDDVLSLTVSGVNKSSAVPFLLDKCNIPYQVDRYKRCVVNDPTHIKRVFEMFDDELLIPKEHTGKNTHTYIDTPMNGVITDYMGNTAEFHERSGVHLEPAEYSLSIPKSYIDYITDINYQIRRYK